MPQPFCSPAPAQGMQVGGKVAGAEALGKVWLYAHDHRAFGPAERQLWHLRNLGRSAGEPEAMVCAPEKRASGGAAAPEGEGEGEASAGQAQAQPVAAVPPRRREPRPLSLKQAALEALIADGVQLDVLRAHPAWIDGDVPMWVERRYMAPQVLRPMARSSSSASAAPARRVASSTAVHVLYHSYRAVICVHLTPSLAKFDPVHGARALACADRCPWVGSPCALPRPPPRPGSLGHPRGRRRLRDGRHVRGARRGAARGAAARLALEHRR